MPLKLPLMSSSSSSGIVVVADAGVWLLLLLLLLHLPRLRALPLVEDGEGVDHGASGTVAPAFDCTETRRSEAAAAAAAVPAGAGSSKETSGSGAPGVYDGAGLYCSEAPFGLLKGAKGLIGFMVPRRGEAGRGIEGGDPAGGSGGRLSPSLS